MLHRAVQSMHQTQCFYQSKAYDLSTLTPKNKVSSLNLQGGTSTLRAKVWKSGCTLFSEADSPVSVPTKTLTQNTVAPGAPLPKHVLFDGVHEGTPVPLNHQILRTHGTLRAHLHGSARAHQTRKCHCGHLPQSPTIGIASP